MAYKFNPVTGQLDITGGASSSGVTDVVNVGTGEGTVVKSVATGTASLKTIKAGTNITVTNNTNDITITSSDIVGATVLEVQVFS